MKNIWIFGLNLLLQFLIATPVSAGTVSGGGAGHGINGKTMEAWVKDIRQLPEFQKYLVPIMVKLSELDKKALGEGRSYFSSPTTFFYLAASKPWYFVDQRINKITSIAAGIPFHMDQYGYHTFDEVYIDKSFYDAGDEKAKALALLHEVVVGLYLSKFMKFSEIFSAIEKMNVAIGSGAAPPNQEYTKLDQWAAYAPHSWNGNLSQAEAVAIRTTVLWIWENYQNLNSLEQFFNFLSNQNFDSRLYTFNSTGTNRISNIHSSGKTILQAMRQLKYAGNPMGLCRVFKSGQIDTKVEKCELNLSFRDNGNLNLGAIFDGFAAVDFEIKSGQNSNSSVDSAFLFPFRKNALLFNLHDQDFSAWKWFNQDIVLATETGMSESGISRNAREGDIITYVYVSLDFKNQNFPEVLALSFRDYAIVGIEEMWKADKLVKTTWRLAEIKSQRLDMTFGQDFYNAVDNPTMTLDRTFSY